MSKPLWILGVDGLDPDLVARWTKAGELPILAELIDSGTYGRLRSTYNQLTASAWVTMATGANPGANGVYNFQERVPGEYRLTLPMSHSRQLPAFWEIASDAGQIVSNVRVPMTYPVRPVTGYAVADWLAPSPESPGFAHPPELAGELVGTYGRAFWTEYWPDAPPQATGKYDSGLQRVLDGADTTVAVFADILARKPTNLFFGVIRETDVGAHVFWAHHDPDYPHQPDSGGRCSEIDPLLAVYQRVDSAIGRLLDETGFEGNLLIVSDHGVGPNTRGPQYVRGLLEASGIMVAKEDSAQRPGLLSRIKSAITRHIPWHIRRRLKPLDQETRSRGFTAELMGDIDFGRSRAFSYLCVQTGEIWFNLHGRDPQGIISPGAEANELFQRIQKLFMQAEDPVTGENPVVEVKRREDIFSGDHMEVIPDIHVRFRDGVYVHGLQSTTKDGRQVSAPPIAEDPRRPSGFHRPYGTLIASGPDIRSSTETVSGHLKDIAPTALSLLGLPVPKHVEGRLLHKVVNPDITASVSDDSGPDRPGVQETYSDEELQDVQKRLEDLGYM